MHSSSTHSLFRVSLRIRASSQTLATSRLISCSIPRAFSNRRLYFGSDSPLRSTERSHWCGSAKSRSKFCFFHSSFRMFSSARKAAAFAIPSSSSTCTRRAQRERSLLSISLKVAHICSSVDIPRPTDNKQAGFAPPAADGRSKRPGPDRPGPARPDTARPGPATASSTQLAHEMGGVWGAGKGSRTYIEFVDYPQPAPPVYLKPPPTCKHLVNYKLLPPACW